ncbi:MAG: hypothetical protein KAJ01_05925, partial [Candidatus Hydrogenedentes bacterium]|nr:hypothetical protein [Candidatus Hydrogenedentota bacterium]
MSGVSSTTWQMLSQSSSSAPLPKGLDAAWDRVSGFLLRSGFHTRRFLRRAALIVNMEKQFRDLTDAKLREGALEY